VRWLLLKDLRILRRSPLLVSLLVLYPVVIAVLIGLALSAGPDKPAVAIYNGLAGNPSEIELGGQRIDLMREGQRLTDAVDPIPVQSRRQAIQKVKDGDALAAVIIPDDLSRNLQSTLRPGTVEVFYNAEDPAKRAYVENTLRAQIQVANAALTKRIAAESVRLLNLISKGGSYSFLGRDFDVLGLARAERYLSEVRTKLPAGSPERKRVDDTVAFARLALRNLSFSDDVLKVVGQPIRVRATALDGGGPSLSSFAVALSVAVSLMFITVLLAAGALALEREENAFLRLVRGLVSHTGLLVEKVALAALCSLVVGLLLLAGLSIFVTLPWDRFALWVAALGLGALGFGALGVAMGALAREVRAASLMAFMASLPIAVLGLVPSGAVSQGVYDAVRAVSALFPFKPTLDALKSALSESGSAGGPLLHLAILTAAFTLLARLALRRFA
jgi:ABC-type multidrug transport system permease subunit